MPITVTCTCAKSFTLKDEFAGQTLACPACAQPITVPTTSKPPDLPYLAPGVGAFDRDRFLLRQRVIAINETYDVADEAGGSILFVQRRTYPLLTILVAVLSVASFALIAGGAFSAMASYFKRSGFSEDTKVIIALVVLAIVITLSVASFILLYSLIFPKRHTDFYTDSTRTNLLCRILQERKIMLLVSTFTLVDNSDQPLARFRRNNFLALFRKHWQVFTPEGAPLAVAKEDSILLSMLRRLFGPMFGLLRTNYVLHRGDGKDESVFGEFNRKLTLFDRYLLDLSGDPARQFDRRTCLALGVLLDTGDRR
jgi:hypothetical protein